MDQALNLHSTIDQVQHELNGEHQLATQLILSGRQIMLYKLVAALGDKTVTVSTD
jgi:hypothetical protein